MSVGAPAAVATRPRARSARSSSARGGPQQQDGTDVGFELLDRPAQRRLAHVQPRGGPAEVAFTGDLAETGQFAIFP